jgi:hypothetical protein
VAPSTENGKLLAVVQRLEDLPQKVVEKLVTLFFCHFFYVF